MSILRSSRSNSVTTTDESVSSAELRLIPLRLGLIADTPQHIARLVSVLKQSHHRIICTELISSLELPLREDLDAWVVCIDDLCEGAATIIEWLNERDIPTLIDEIAEGEPPRTPMWYEAKIHACVAANLDTVEAKPRPAPKRIWVLAASTGGPEAVALFLTKLSEDAHNSAFFYAQHIDQQALVSLIMMLKKRSSLEVRICTTGQQIEAGVLYLVSPDHEFEITASQRLSLTGQKWKGIYRPSINQVIAKVARVYREKAGAIILSGMGDDGTDAVRLMKTLGGLIYIQTLESCTVDSMPRCVQATGLVDFTADVELLASKVTSVCKTYS